MMVVKTFLQAGAPIGEVDQSHFLFEETGYHDAQIKNNKLDLIPFILEDKKMRTKFPFRGIS